MTAEDQENLQIRMTPKSWLPVLMAILDVAERTVGDDPVRLPVSAATVTPKLPVIVPSDPGRTGAVGAA
jgi:hypothetical protein